MRKFGIKLWSNDFVKNPNFVRQCVKSVKDGYFEYIELFVLPNTYEDIHAKIKNELKDISVVIHAPHSGQGFDTGNRERFAQNCSDLKASQQYADLLNSNIIILHPGFEDSDDCLNESIRQFKMFNDARIAVENMPYLCSSTNRILHGTSPAQIRKFVEEVKCQFCFDMSHAICSSNSYKRDIFADLAEYKSLNPVVYHFCDGHFASHNDEHLHCREGDYDLSLLLNKYIDEHAFVTMETGKGLPTSIQPWLEDIVYIKSLEK